MIDDATSDLSKELRSKFMKLEECPIWGVEFVKTSKEWLEIMKLSDEIRKAMNSMWSKSELEYFLDSCTNIRRNG